MMEQIEFALVRMLHLPPKQQFSVFTIHTDDPQAFKKQQARELDRDSWDMAVVKDDTALPGQFILRGSRDGQPVTIIAGFYD